MDIIKKVQHFLGYWYQRYLLATELYMVEPWEKVVIHVLYLLIFGLFSYFNYCVLLNAVSHLRGTTGWIQTYDQKN